MTEYMKHVPKGWGSELWVVNSDLYCGKILLVLAHRRTALHYHARKDETFFLSKGVIAVHYCQSVKTYVHRVNNGFPLELAIISRGQPFCVPPGLVHMIEAVVDAEIIEFSTKHEDADSFYIQKGNEEDWGEGIVAEEIRNLVPKFQSIPDWATTMVADR